MDKLQNLFLKNKKTLAVAESCTGGFISSMITKTPGSSKYYLGGFVTYSNLMKQKILGIDEGLLEKHSAVSVEVAFSMCQKVLEKANSDYAIAVTGYAGPDGDDVGLVYGAFGDKEQIFVGKIPGLEGLGREGLISKSAGFLLDSIYHYVNERKVPVAYQ